MVASVTSMASAIGDDETLVVAMNSNDQEARMVHLQSWAKNDLNLPEDQLRCSELSWQSWVAYAGPNAANLHYIQRHGVTNQESANVWFCHTRRSRRER